MAANARAMLDDLLAKNWEVYCEAALIVDSMPGQRARRTPSKTRRASLALDWPAGTSAPLPNEPDVCHALRMLVQASGESRLAVELAEAVLDAEAASDGRRQKQSGPVRSRWVESREAARSSAVGHELTAAVFSAVLGVPVACRRETVCLPYGARVVVGQYRGPRLPEGATSLPEGATIEWLHVEVGPRPATWCAYCNGTDAVPGDGCPECNGTNEVVL